VLMGRWFGLPFFGLIMYLVYQLGSFFLAPGC